MQAKASATTRSECGDVLGRRASCQRTSLTGRFRSPIPDSAVRLDSGRSMDGEQDHAEELAQHRGRLLVLACLAPIVGALAGLVGAIFRLALVHADRWRDAMIAWAQGYDNVGFALVTLACAAAVAIAAGLVRRI